MIRHLKCAFICGVCVFGSGASGEGVVILTPDGPAQTIGLGMATQFQREGIAATVAQYPGSDPFALAAYAQNAIENGAELLVIPEIFANRLSPPLTDLGGGQVFSGHPEQGGTGLVIGYEWAFPTETLQPPQAVFPKGVNVTLDPAGVVFWQSGFDEGMSDLQVTIRDMLEPSPDLRSPYTLFPPLDGRNVPVIGLPFVSDESGCGCDESTALAGACDPDGLELSPDQLVPLPDGRLRLNLRNHNDDGCGCDGYAVPVDQFSSTNWGIKFATARPYEFGKSLEYINTAEASHQSLMVFACDPD